MLADASYDLTFHSSRYLARRTGRGGHRHQSARTREGSTVYFREGIDHDHQRRAVEMMTVGGERCVLAGPANGTSYTVSYGLRAWGSSTVRFWQTTAGPPI
jgi:hypothetical protein